MIRLGLCCIFREAPIKFRRTTARHVLSLPKTAQAEKLAAICRDNAEALHRALEFCAHHQIGAFRINSQLLPLKTHPEAGYDLQDLPGGARIIARLKQCGAFGRQNGIRTSFHPDQFLVLASPDGDVVQRAIADLEAHAQLAQWVAADVINVHAGGAYGNKSLALKRLIRVITSLPTRITSRLTLENDDRVYTPADLLPVCLQTGIPLVYDVHHHRCLPDGNGIPETTQAVLATWNREPLFHISSPVNGWDSACRPHHDFIDPNDFPDCWRELAITVDVEAKAKEVAVLKLSRWLGQTPFAHAVVGPAGRRLPAWR